jgi:hypothetical protein
VLSHFYVDHVVNLEEAPLYQGLPTVLLAPPRGRYIQGETSLLDFDHPEEALYVFGPDNEHFSGLEADHLVYIPTDSKDEMYSWVACVVTMWDRRLQYG